jgi:hypothetical protein
MLLPQWLPWLTSLASGRAGLRYFSGPGRGLVRVTKISRARARRLPCHRSTAASRATALAPVSRAGSRTRP